MSIAKLSQQSKIETKALPIGSRMLALEPRYVFDAAIATELSHALEAGYGVHESAPEASDMGSSIVTAARELDGGADDFASLGFAVRSYVDAHNLSSSNNEVAFIDSRLADLGTLVSSVPDGTRIVLIDGAKDGVAQMVDALSGQSGVTGVHILGHGSPGNLMIGSSVLNAESMAGVYRSDLAALGANLSADADILVYGCDFAAGDAGARSSAMLAELTGADIAASEDLTGSAGQGGDWVLEVRTGTIEAVGLSAESYEHLLTLGNTTNWTISGLSASNAVQGVTATISFDSISPQSSVVLNNGAETFNTNTYFANAADGDRSLRFIFNWDTAPESAPVSPPPAAPTLPAASTDGGTATLTITFSQPVTNPVIHLDRLGGNMSYDPNTDVSGDELSQSSSALFTLTTPGATLTDLTVPTNVPHFEVTPTTIQRTPFANQTYFAASPPSFVEAGTIVDSTAAGSVMVNGTFTTLTFELSGVGAEGAGGDGIEIGLAIDAPPNAQDDAFTLAEDATLIANLFSSNGSDVDSDPTADALTIVEIDGAPFAVGVPITLTHGTLTITNATTGVFTFTPNADYVGEESFTYTIADANGGIDTATANIIITAVNEAPVDGDETNAVTEDTPLSVDAASGLLADAVDPDGAGASITGYTIDGMSGTQPVATPVAISGVGAITINADGSYEFVPEPNYNGTIPVITYTVSDGITADDITSTLTLTMTPVNDEPTGTDKTISLGAGLTYALTTADFGFADPIDTPANALKELIIKSLPPAAEGELSLNGLPVALDQVIAAVDVPNLVFTPAPGVSGTGIGAFTFQVVDDGGTADGGIDTDQTPNTITFDVLAAPNDPPRLVDPVPGVLTTPEIDPNNPSNLVVPVVDGKPMSLVASDYFTDPNTGDVIEITVDPADLPDWLAYDPNTQTFSGTPPVDNGADIVIPVTVVDDKGLPFNGTITIKATNPPPVAMVDGTSTGPLEPVVVDLTGNDIDPDDDPLEVIAASLADPLSGTLSNAGGVYTFTPAAGFSGTAVINYTIKDQDGAESSSTHEVVVGPMDPPVAVNDVYTTPYGEPVNGDVKTDDTFAPGSIFSLFSPPLNGAVAFNPDGTFVYAPDEGFVGTETFIYKITDPAGQTTYASEVIKVTKPALIAVSDTFVTAYETALDGAAGTGDTYAPGSTFIPITAPTNGTLTMNSDGTYVYTPKPGFSGTDLFAYAVTDETGQTRFATEFITISPPPAPVAVDDSYTTAYQTPVNGSAGAADTYALGAAFTAISQPTNGTLVFNADGSYTYTPRAGFAGTDTFTYKVTDPNGQFATATETITISPPALVAVNDSYSTANETPLNGNAAAGDTFAPGSTFAVTTPPSSGTVTMNADGTYVYTPAPGFTGTATFSYTVTDPTGQTRSAVDTIIVGPPRLIAVHDVYLAVADTPLDGNAAAGDIYSPGSVFAAVTQPSRGSLQMNSDGTYRYVPAPGFTGTDSFTYSITDLNGQVVTATETITVAARRVTYTCLTTFGAFGSRLVR